MSRKPPPTRPRTAIGRRLPTAEEMAALRVGPGYWRSMFSDEEAREAWLAWRHLIHPIFPGQRSEAWWWWEDGIPEHLRSDDAFFASMDPPPACIDDRIREERELREARRAYIFEHFPEEIRRHGENPHRHSQRSFE